MQYPLCEVIGCRTPAAWKRSSPYEDSVFGQYLCDEHYDMLADNRRMAARYVSLTDEAEVTPEHEPGRGVPDASKRLLPASGDMSHYGNAATPIRVLIADNYPLIRDGLAALIQRSDDLLVAGEASNGQEAVERFIVTRPDVTVMELCLPVMDGVAAITRIRKISPQARIIVLTTYEGDQDIYRSVQAGARGYLLKDVGQSDILETIRRVAQGLICIPPKVATKLAERLNKLELTAREQEVLRLLASGSSNLEIARELCIAEGTVKTHVNNILNKMDVPDRTSAVVQGIRRGLVQLR